MPDRVDCWWKPMRGAALIASALILSAVPVAADTYDDAVEAYDRGDYETSVLLNRVLAEQGHAAAQFNLGIMYANGEGVAQDFAEAAKWYRKAAVQGLADAQYNLGLMYHRGEGVPEDDAEAVTWFREAAEQGLAAAQYNLGVMYANGKGVLRDEVLAHMWFSLAADQGDDDARRGRDAVAQRMAPKQIAEAMRLARKWKAGHQ